MMEKITVTEGPMFEPMLHDEGWVMGEDLITWDTLATLGIEKGAHPKKLLPRNPTLSHKVLGLPTVKLPKRNSK